MKKTNLSILILIILVSTLSSCTKQNRVKWKNFNDAIIEQVETGKPLMFFFYSTSCMYCKLLENSTLNNREIAEVLNKEFIPVKLDIDNKLPLGKNLPSPSNLAATFKVKGVPAVFFVNKEHKVIKRIIGYQPVFLFKKHLKEVVEACQEN